MVKFRGAVNDIGTCPRVCSFCNPSPKSRIFAAPYRKRNVLQLVTTPSVSLIHVVLDLS